MGNHSGEVDERSVVKGARDGEVGRSDDVDGWVTISRLWKVRYPLVIGPLP